MSSEKKIDVFFVDIGKVLVNFDNFKLYEKLAGVSGVSVGKVEKIDREIFRPLWPEMETSKMLPYQVYQRFKIELAKNTPPDRRDNFLKSFTFSFFKEASMAMLSLKPRVLDLLKFLHKTNCKIILTSNTSSYLYDVQRLLFPQIFSNIDGCIVSHEIGYRKPERAFWLLALDEVRGVLLERIFVIDDLEENVNSAKLLGMNGAVFTNVESLKSELEKFGFNFKK